MPPECLICGDAECRSIRSFSSETVAQRYILAEVDRKRHNQLRDHIERLWGLSTCTVVECRRCDFAFANPFVAGDPTFYQLSSHNTNYPKWKWEFQKTLDHLRERIARGRVGHLLEIGAGNGAMLEAAADAGWPRDQLTALEYSSSGMQAIRGANITCHPLDVRSLAVDSRFDVICMFQVLEHLDDLDGLFNKLYQLTLPTSDLFIAVPNNEWQRENEAFGIDDDFPPNHITRWSRESFNRLAQRFGWFLSGFELEPPNRLWAARYAFQESLLRKSEQTGSLANRLVRIADHTHPKSASRLVKLGAGLSQPRCWEVAIRRFGKSPPPHQWVRLTRQPTPGPST